MPISRLPGHGGIAPLKIFLGLAVLASSFQTACAAQIESTVFLNYRYTLTDLAPLDNIAPSLTLTKSARYIYAQTSNDCCSDYPYVEDDENSFSPLSRSATVGADKVASSITGSAEAGAESLSARTFTTTADDNGIYEDTRHEAGAGREFYGMLSANTAITVYFDFALSSTSTSHPDSFAGASLAFKMWHDDLSDPRPSDFLVFNYREAISAGGTRSFSATHTYENRKSSAELIGSNATVSAWSALPLDPLQVPEPATYLMFATGLALLASRKRRGIGRIV